MAKRSFTEIANAQISESRRAVISKVGDGGYTIGQKMCVKDGSETITVFLKGALHIDDIDGIQHLRDALNAVLSGE